MKSAIFSTPTQSYQVANIVYAGSVGEIPENYRKNDSTHSFKLITTLGAAFCYYNNLDTARNARDSLWSLMEMVKPNLFKSGYEALDPRSVVSFGRVFKLKTLQGDHTHAFVITMTTNSEQDTEVWLTYKSEDHAEKARKALYAAIHTVNNMTMEKPKPVSTVNPSIAAPSANERRRGLDGLPF